MKKTTIVTALFFILIQSVFAQSGENVYTFLSLPSSAHVAALGGTNVSINNNDINFTIHNPALLSEKMNNQVALNATNYLSDAFFGSASYSHKLDDKNYLAIGILFLDFGNFSERNEYGEEIGEFSALDAAIHLMYGRKLSENWNIGATLKPIFSSYEKYSSFGLAVDVGMSYHTLKSGFSGGFVLKNMGRQLTGYYKEDSQHNENFPFEIQAGITQKLSHAPFRISITGHDLQRWDMSYENGLTTTNSSGITENVDNDLSFGENLMRHLIFGLELVPSDKFYIALGYNYQRGREMKVLENKSINGFSFGAGLKIKMVKVDFSLAKYHMSNTSYHFSLAMDLGAFNF